MLACLSLLILAALPGATTSEARHPDAVAIFDCQFDRAWDVNYDNWPDNWLRTLGPKLPHYVSVAIEPEQADPTNRCLAVHVDGGGAHLGSPLVTVSDNFSYKAECRLRMAGLKYAKAQVRVEFYDDSNTCLQVASSDWQKCAPQADWVQLHIGPVNPTDPRITSARLVLHVAPVERADLSGQVFLDDVWMARLPKMTVTTGNPYNVYTDKNDIQVTCDLSGILDSDPDILFELLDASSQRLEGSRVQL
ncbi:MAG TPA: hypothetical protein VEQ85_06225, partial [Lacipirellulaceae bacterium]|nr:hypothetical protein [Lacipirellulaceae bacterium]